MSNMVAEQLVDLGGGPDGDAGAGAGGRRAPAAAPRRRRRTRAAAHPEREDRRGSGLPALDAAATAPTPATVTGPFRPTGAQGLARVVGHDGRQELLDASRVTGRRPAPRARRPG